MKVNVVSTSIKKLLVPVGLAVGLTVASMGLTATPASALTLRTIVDVQTGNYLNSSGQVGNVVGAAVPVPNGYVGSWYFQLVGPGDLYYIHPSNNTNLCLTASTTQNLEKIENCVGAINQKWADQSSGGNEYGIASDDANLPGGGVYLTDPSSSHGNHAVITTLGGGYPNDAWIQT